MYTYTPYLSLSIYIYIYIYNIADSYFSIETNNVELSSLRETRVSTAPPGNERGAMGSKTPPAY